MGQSFAKTWALSSIGSYDDSEDSSMEELESEIDTTKQSIETMPKEVLENQRRMEQACKDQSDKLEKLEKAFDELRHRLDGPEYGIIQWKADIRHLAQAMKLVDTPDKNHKHKQLKDAIQTLDNTKRKRALITQSDYHDPHSTSSNSL